MYTTLLQFVEKLPTLSPQPPLHSDSFYTIGTGIIKLFHKADNVYKITISEGVVHTGDGNLFISDKSHHIIHELHIDKDATLVIDRGLTIENSRSEIKGIFELTRLSRVYFRGTSHGRFHIDSSIIVNDGSDFIVEKTAMMTIAGSITISIDRLKSVTNKKNIYIAYSAILNVTGIPFDMKHYSVQQYWFELQHKQIPPNSISEKVFNNGRSTIGYKWVAGNHRIQCEIIDLILYQGDAIMGDLKLMFYGTPKVLRSNNKSMRNLIIRKNSTLHVTPKYRDSTYIRPELYIGAHLPTNIERVAECIVEGNIRCYDGANIILDRNGRMIINGMVSIEGESKIINAEGNNQVTLVINGTLVIDRIEQIGSFVSENIKFGDNGKVIINNPSPDEGRITLFSTPNGIKSSILHRILLKEHLEHVEYHINKNTGIEIDQFYTLYNKEMREWFGGKRIEYCIKQRYIVWDGGFIELNHNVIPWVNKHCSLLDAARLFKTSASYQLDILEDVVKRLIYANSGPIVFRFVDGDEYGEVFLDLTPINIRSIYYNAIKGKYILRTDNDGTLVLQNNTSSITSLDKTKRREAIINRYCEFVL